MHISDTVKTYFSSKQKQLVEASKQAITPHNSLKGNFRESLIDIYLRNFLPKRYSIGKGIIYSRNGTSKEADIVVWDSYNHSCLEMNNHSIFFAETVKAVFEIKTNWSNSVLNDILLKSKTVKALHRLHKNNLYFTLISLENEIEYLKSQDTNALIFKSNPDTIPFIAFVFKGGHQFDPRKIKNLETVHKEWPDFIFFLETGKILIKEYFPHPDDPLHGKGFLRLYDMSEQALLLFTSELSVLLFEKSVSVEQPFFLHDYLIGLFDDTKIIQAEFPCIDIPGAVN